MFTTTVVSEQVDDDIAGLSIQSLHIWYSTSTIKKVALEIVSYRYKVLLEDCLPLTQNVKMWIWANTAGSNLIASKNRGNLTDMT